MGILSKITKAQREMSNNQSKKLQEKVSNFMLPGEDIEYIKSVKEDFICLTNKKVIFVDGNLLSSKKSVTMLPYSKITSVSLEQGGFMKFSKNVMIGYGSRVAEVDTYSKETAQEVVALLLQKIQ